MGMITDYVPTGMENACSRKSIQIAGGYKNERQVRYEISEYNRNGDGKHLIINLGTGYFIPSENEYGLVAQWVKQEISRSRAIEESVRAGKRYLEREGQIEFG